MSSFSMRPRFTQTLDLEPEAAREKIVRAVDLLEERCEVKSFPGFICLRIPEHERHFWSPRLTLGLENCGDGKTRIEGIYGPNANVWSLFLYGYLISGTFGLFAGIFGGVQLLIGQYAWAMWIFGAMASIVAGLYLSGIFGRKLAETQTQQLHRIYEIAMGSTDGAS